MKLIIDRQKWLRGERDSCLLRGSDHKMCCLGFLSLQYGYTEEEITGVTTPLGLIGKFTKNLFPASLLDGEVSDKLMVANDALMISDAERESRLTKQFAAIGIKVEFIN